MNGRMDPLHTSVCTVCWQGTWYAPTVIEVSPAHDYKPAFVTDPSKWAYGQRAHAHGTPDAEHLRVIDRSGLAPAFARYYESGERIRVRFSYGEERTGTIGKTTGWRPSYLLMLRSSSISSPYTLSADDRVIAVKHGRNYVAQKG